MEGKYQAWVVVLTETGFGDMTAPCLNQWYKCKLRDDWYKIVKQERVENQTLYKVVSFREGQDKFFGLTLAQARSVIQIETYKIGVI